MTVEVTDATVGIWLIKHKDGLWVVTISQKEDGTVVIQEYKKGKINKTKKVKKPVTEVIQSLFNAVGKLLSEVDDAEAGWEAVRGARLVEEYMDVLRALPGFKEANEP